MSYLAFALKYRPQNFDQVIGQERVVVSLQQAILKKRVHHAYLFSGPRGVGKTSLARILARSLNCLEGPTIKPCGKCPSCLEISRGASLDIIEIDGASNRGIDEIRTLRENVKLSSAGGRFKIYIIDEVHMLTHEAFNALLKTLEEPPAHVKFIFATTHPQKVLPTILSRCQKFQFTLLSVEKIVEKLRRIVKSEGLKIEDSLLYAVARAAGGSIRDAESLLDQLSPVILEKGRVEDVLSFLGVIDEETLNSGLRYIVEKDIIASLGLIDRVVNDGKDLSVFLNALIEQLRNLLLAKVSINGFRGLIDISPQTKDFILSLSELIATPEVLEAIDLLIEAKDLSTKLNTARIPLELALIKFSYQEEEAGCPQKASVQAAKKANNPQSAPAQPAPGPDEQLGLEIEELDLEEEESRERIDNHLEEKDGPAAANDNILLEELRRKWGQILTYTQKIRAALASHLSAARLFSSRESVVDIAFPRKDYFHKEIVEENKNLKFIEGVVSKIMGKNIGIRFTFLKDDPAGQKESAKAKGTENMPDKEISDEQNNFINNILDTFGGKIHTDD